MIYNKNMKISFKKHPKETGLQAVGYPYQSVDIKLNGKVVGVIHAPNWQSEGWKVNFAVMKNKPDGNPNCDWKWIKLNKIFENEEDAREAIKNNIVYITNNYTLHNLNE